MQQSTTTQFNIGISKVFVGPMTEVLRLSDSDNREESYSIGLIKNFSLTSETNEVTLTQGLRNTQVDSQVTGVTTSMSMEVYEYTARNIAYAAGLQGMDFNWKKTYELAADVAGGASATSIMLKDANAADFNVGDILCIQSTSDKQYDKVYPVVVKSVEADSGTPANVKVTFDVAIQTGWEFKTGDKVFAVNLIPIGSDEAQPYYGVKIVGILPNGNEPVTIICPKAKITAGFTLGFTTDNYGNMPFQITPYDLTRADLEAFSAEDKKILAAYNANLFVLKN